MEHADGYTCITVVKYHILFIPPFANIWNDSDGRYKNQNSSLLPNYVGGGLESLILKEVNFQFSNLQPVQYSCHNLFQLEIGVQG